MENINDQYEELIEELEFLQLKKERFLERKADLAVLINTKAPLYEKIFERKKIKAKLLDLKDQLKAVDKELNHIEKLENEAKEKLNKFFENKKQII